MSDTDPMLDSLREGLAPRYRVERALGVGGMARVYLARDTELGRTVAVKVLDPGILAFGGAERFLREVETTAGLDHPYVVPLLESGEVGGILYYVMPHVEGETLRARLDREGPLPLDDCVRITAQVADALAYAHERGIIHRDIKPSNILLSAGHARVADFGIAKALTSAGGEGATQTGVAMGTARYMSPEQAEGGDIDARSDQYSLACVAFEMVTGECPYTGRNAAAILARRLTQPVPRAQTLRETVPDELDDAIARGMAKAPADRFPSVRDFARAVVGTDAPTGTPGGGRAVQRAAPGSGRRSLLLAAGALAAVAAVVATVLRVGTGTTPTGDRMERIAVLPLQSRSGDSLDYLAEGMQDALISELSRVEGLSILGRASVARYGTADVSPAVVGAELDADATVHGMVSAFGDSVSLHLELIDTRTEATEWARDFRVGSEEVLSLQARVASEIAAALERSGPAGAREPEGEADPDAVEAYLRGRFVLNRGDFTTAVRYFQDAVAIDPDFADAHAWLAMFHNQSYFFGVSPNLAFDRGRTEARTAIALDPENALAHTALGYALAAYDWNWDQAEREFRLGLELDPSSDVTTATLAFFLSWRGRHDEGLALALRSEELDPVSPQNLANTAFILFNARRFEEAAEKAREALALDPNYLLARHRLAMALVALGRLDEAGDLADGFSRDEFSSLALAGWVYGRTGRDDDARALLERLLALETETYVPPTHMAWIHLGLGEPEPALEWLEIAVRGRDPHVALLATLPIYDPVRGTPGFQALLRRVEG